MGDAQMLAGRYRLTERLGSGGMSVVWRGRDEVLDRHVAVKVLSGEYLADPASRDLIRAEAKAAAALSHPHLVNVYDYGESPQPDGTRLPFVVMELVQGPTLADRLKGGPLPWRAALRICAEVAAGLAAAHARDLVHRDVKPANVMLTDTGVKVVDFGIAAAVGELADRSADGVVLGTPAYLAPERVSGDPVTPATDVYAVGLMLFRALAGKLPWAVDTTTGIVRAHLTAEPAELPPIDGLPPTVGRLCRRCLAKDPEKRPSSADLARQLAQLNRLEPLDVHLYDAHAPAPAPPRRPVAPAADRPRRRSRRNLVRAGAVAATVIAGGVMVVTYPKVAQWRGPAQAVGTGPGHGAGAQPGCAVRYDTRQDSGGTFTVDLRLSHDRDKPVPGWSLAFDFPGDQRVVGAAGAAVTQSGRTVTVRSATASALAPGTPALLSFTGSYHGANKAPATFTLNGARCTVTTSAPDGGGTGTSPNGTGTTGTGTSPAGGTAAGEQAPTTGGQPAGGAPANAPGNGGTAPGNGNGGSGNGHGNGGGNGNGHGNGGNGNGGGGNGNGVGVEIGVTPPPLPVVPNLPPIGGGLGLG